MDTQSSAGLPRTQSWTWSMAALAAEAAELEPRASMMAAPRFCTVGMKSLSSHAWSEPAAPKPFVPATPAWHTSGCWVAVACPQIVVLVMSVPLEAAFLPTLKRLGVGNVGVVRVDLGCSHRLT